MISQNEKAARFVALHQAPGAFVIANPWDAGSARLLAGLGFEALATSSGASAGILGKRDGQVTREVAIMRDELRGNTGFDYRNIMAAAQFCATNKINLEEALTWADAAISMPFIGKEEFATLQTKAAVLRALNKNTEADAIMDKAVNHETANVQNIHQYARTLLAEGKKEKALEVFKLNRQRNPDDKFTTYVGLARGYTAVGDNKNAIKNWEVAIKNLPENQKQNLSFYEGELKKLKGGV